MAGSNWTISGLTIVIITLFSQYLRSVKVPYPKYKNGEVKVKKFPLFKMFPVLLGLIGIWIICAIMTAAADKTEGAFADSSSVWYKARTDTKLSVIHTAPWFRFVYPFQKRILEFDKYLTISNFTRYFLLAILRFTIQTLSDWSPFPGTAVIGGATEVVDEDLLDVGARARRVLFFDALFERLVHFFRVGRVRPLLRAAIARISEFHNLLT